MREPPADVKKEEMKQRKTIVDMEVTKTPYPVAHFNHLCKTDKEKVKEFHPPCDAKFLFQLDSILMGWESRMQLNIRLTHNITKNF